MATFIAAALQLGPASAGMAETTDRILELMEDAAAKGASLAVLPELALSPYFAAEVHGDISLWADVAQNQAALARIAAKAGELKLATVMSYADLQPEGLCNTQAFFDQSGALAGRFRRMHIPGRVDPDPAMAFNMLEKRYFLPGNLGFPAFELGQVKAGDLICYDRRFPESYRSLMFAGADMFCVCYNSSIMPGVTLEKTRFSSKLAICGGAYANATWIIVAGKAGDEEGCLFIDGSFVCSPEGEIVAQAQTLQDEAVVAKIDLTRQKGIRDRWAFAVNRAQGAYVPSAGENAKAA